MKLIFTLFFIFLLIKVSYPQKPSEKQLEKFHELSSVDDARKFQKKNKELDIVIFRTNSAQDSATLSMQLYEAPLGTVLTYSSPKDGKMANIKLLGKDTIPTHRVKYIYLDGSVLGMNEIDSTRQEILLKFSQGIPFKKLVEDYNMDENDTNGDIGWYRDGTMAMEFQDEVKLHSKGEIFKVNIESEHAYFIVLKTHPSLPAVWVEAIQLKL